MRKAAPVIWIKKFDGQQHQLRSGDVVHVGKAASVQFWHQPILFRVIHIHDWDTYVGWVWLDGCALNHTGDAVERRTIWVQPAGLRTIPKAPDQRTRNTRPAVPQPRAGGNTGQRARPAENRGAA